MRIAHWFTPDASGVQIGEGAAPDGQVKPRPKMRAPSLSSLMNDASTIQFLPNHHSAPTVERLRSILRSRSWPVPTAGRSVTMGEVLPEPSRLVLIVRG